MNKEQVDLLGEYIKFGKSVILMEEIPDKVIQKGEVIKVVAIEDARIMIDKLSY